MSKNSNTEWKGLVLKMSFVVALIVHTVSDDSFFAFSNNWLFSKRLATIIWFIYNLYGTIFITSEKIVDATSEKNKNIHTEYGIHGVTDPFMINSTNVFRYVYQVHGSTQ